MVCVCVSLQVRVSLQECVSLLVCVFKCVCLCKCVCLSICVFQVCIFASVCVKPSWEILKKCFHVWVWHQVSWSLHHYSGSPSNITRKLLWFLRSVFASLDFPHCMQKCEFYLRRASRWPCNLCHFSRAANIISNILFLSSQPSNKTGITSITFRWDIEEPRFLWL